MVGAVQWQRGRAGTGEPGDAVGGDCKCIFRVAGNQPVRHGGNPGHSAQLPERSAGGLWRGCAPEEAGMDDPAGEKFGRKMKTPILSSSPSNETATRIEDDENEDENINHHEYEYHQIFQS